MKKIERNLNIFRIIVRSPVLKRKTLINKEHFFFLKAMEWNLYFDPMVRNQSKTENNHKKNQEFQKQEEPSSIRPRSIILKPKRFEDEYDSDDSGSCSICSGNIKKFSWFKSQEFAFFLFICISSVQTLLDDRKSLIKP